MLLRKGLARAWGKAQCGIDNCLEWKPPSVGIRDGGVECVGILQAYGMGQGFEVFPILVPR